MGSPIGKPSGRWQGRKTIRSGQHADGVFAFVVDADEGTTTGLFDALHTANIDALCTQAGQQFIAKSIAPQSANKGHRRAQPCRRHRLVRAFAAMVARKTMAQHGLPGRRYLRHPGDQIHVDGARDEDHVFTIAARSCHSGITPSA